MKLCKITLLSTIFIFIFALTAYAETNTITASVETYDLRIEIRGCAKNSNNVSLLVGSQDNIIYINQKKPEADGSFVFNFEFDTDMPAGQYPFKIGADSGAEVYEGVIDYPGNLTFEQGLFSTADFYILVGDHIAKDGPEVKITINCTEGTSTSVKLYDTTFGSISFDEEITSEDGECVLHDILDVFYEGTEYILEMCSKDKFGVKMTIKAKISPNEYGLMTIDYSTDFSKNSKLYARYEFPNYPNWYGELSFSKGGSFTETLPILSPSDAIQIDTTLYANLPINPLPGIEESVNSKLYYALKRSSYKLDPNRTGQITIEELNNLTGILDLSNSNIERIGGLQYCKNIYGLILNNNKISDLGYISELKNLKILKAKNNKITSLKPLSKLESLVHIDLSSNQITGVSALSNLKHIKYLNLSNNKIKDISSLKNIIYHSLYLNGNYYLSQSSINKYKAFFK